MTDTLAEALTLTQAGRLAEAEAACRALLERRPDQADALQLLGVLRARSGAFDEACAALRQAIGLDPQPRYHYNLGNVLKAMGRSGEAEAAYRAALDLKPDFAEALNNLAGIALEQGRAEAAERLYRRLLAGAPGLALAHNNRGNALLQMGRLDQAEAAFRAAITCDPAYPEARLNLGALLLQSGRVAPAIAALDEALRLRPDYAEAEINLGYARRDAGQVEAAVAGLARATERFADDHRVWAAFAEVVAAWRPAVADPLPRRQLLAALRRPEVSPQPLVPAALCLLRLDPRLTALAELAGRPDHAPALRRWLESPAAAVLDDPLLLALLHETIVADFGFETVLTALRRALLSLSAVDGEHRDRLLPFACALASQCFATEYVQAETPDETETIRAGTPQHPFALAVFACYRPLHDLAGRMTEGWPAPLAELVRRQVDDVAEERRLAAAIPVLTAIDDRVSRAVGAQYEDHPYPRWERIARTGAPQTLAKYLGRVLPFAGLNLALPDQPEILIAGCGTGEQSIRTALDIRGSRILAVDLSRASLAYALRMTRRLGIANIDYAQADILRLGGIDRRFDMIECAGVLHHMADPLEGWRVLTDLLRPGGVMMIGLYSALARRGIAELRRRLDPRLVRETADIRRLRPHLQEFAASEDFFSASACRDLLFHTQEHSFTIPGIAEALAALGLRFVGFTLKSPVLRAYRQRFPQDPTLTDLGNWDRLERENTAVFSSMYQFFAVKQN